MTKLDYGQPLVNALGKKMGWGNSDIDTLQCPICGFECNHPGDPTRSNIGDYEADWPGRGDLIVIPMEGECGSRWEICFGFHKGNVAAFTRVLTSCDQMTGLVDQVAAALANVHKDDVDRIVRAAIDKNGRSIKL